MFSTPQELEMYPALAAKLVAALTHWHFPIQASVPIQRLVEAAQEGPHGLHKYIYSQSMHEVLSDLEYAGAASVCALAYARLARIQLATSLSARKEEAEKQLALAWHQLKCALKGDPHLCTLATKKLHLQQQLKRLQSPQTALVPTSGNGGGRVVQRQLKIQRQHWNSHQIR